MIYRQLGRSDLRISEIGFGCMSLSHEGASPSDLLQAAADRGINFFDTADLYQQGLNEEWVGKAFRHMRNKVIIATKGGNQLRAGGNGWDWNPRKEYILSAAEKSLKRLQTDYIDLYQLHGGTINDPIDETIEAFELLRQQGKIRYYGISSIRPDVIREYVKRSSIVSVMMQYSLLDRRPEESCFPLLQQNNTGVLARGTMAGGLLIHKSSKPYLNYSAEQVQQAAHALAAIDSDKTAAAIGFVLRNPAVTSAVTGIRTPEQLENILAVTGKERLSEVQLSQLKEVIPVNYYDQHR